MPMGGAMLGGGMLLGGVGSMFGGKKGADASKQSAQLQYAAMQQALATQKQMADKGFGVFQSEAEKARGFLSQQNSLAQQQLQPFRDIGLKSLQGLSDFASDPNSPLAQAERANFQKVLSRNLAARGLTASGTEMAALGDFELGLMRERNAISQGIAGGGVGAANQMAGLTAGLGQGLAGITQQLGGTAASLYGNLGQGLGNTLMQGTQGIGQANIMAGQFQAQGLAGLNNTLQTGLMGFGQLRQANQSNAFQQGLLSLLMGGGQGGGSMAGDFNLGSMGNIG